MRHLVSGAAGFIGSHLCDSLLDRGDEVVGADNFITGSFDNIAHIQAHPSFTFLECDVSSPIEIPCRFDQVWHLASIASPKFYLKYPIQTLESGSAATRNMLEIARRDKCRFLLASTSEIYGDPLQHPQIETYWGNVNPVGTRSCYDESKRFAEALTMAYHRSYDLPTNIARIFNTYGPRMALDDGRVVPAFLRQALSGEPITVYGDGRQTRSFCYVSDMVNGLIRLSSSVERLPVNLGNPLELTVIEFAEKIRALVGCDSPLVFEPLPLDDPNRRRPDISKAARLLGWTPQVDLDTGLRQTIADFQSRLPVGVAARI